MSGPDGEAAPSDWQAYEKSGEAMIWQHLTNLASLSSCAVLGGVIVAGYALGNSWRAVAWWVGALALCLAIVAASKIAFIGWGIGIRAADFTGFSGHAARAMFIMPILFHGISQTLRLRTKLLGLLAGVLIGGAISVSRYVLHFHSISEVTAGAILGGGLAAMFLVEFNTSSMFAKGVPLALAGTILLLILPHPDPRLSQQLLTDIALRLSGHQVPFTRENWRAQGNDALIANKRN